MPESFLQLPMEDRKAILSKASQELGRSINILEKDVWVCWVLQKLFEFPNVPRMAFKGGTSLSKVFDVIARFSEDVDVTLDRTELVPDLDPFSEAEHSNTRRKKAIRTIDQRLIEYTNDSLKPYFDQCLKDELADESAETEFIESSIELRIPYPSANPSSSKYLLETVRLELGARNKVEPAEKSRISPYIAQFVSELHYPEPTVSVLSPSRTFWEKSTLIHVECTRENVRPDVSRLSRHWYDLVELAKVEIGKKAIVDQDLLRDVVLQKSVLYRATNANYDDCLAGRFRLVPSDLLRGFLQKDYQDMQEAGMFWQTPPEFDVLMEEIGVLEELINESRQD